MVSPFLRRFAPPLALVLLAAGCQRGRDAGPTGTMAVASDIPEVLATIGGDRITMADVRQRAGDDLDEMQARYERARYNLVQGTLDEIVQDRVLQAEARRQNKTVDQLVADETGGSVEPSDSEIAAWYKANPTRTGGRALQQIRPQIANFLRTERRKAALARLNERLSSSDSVKILLPPYRLALDNARAPARGPAGAAVTLVEFSDFQCPFCGQFYPTLKEIERKYGDQIRIVYRQYPLTSLHPNAFKAAEASLCANDQGKFWEMHDAMFEDQARLAVRDLKASAGRLGLDQQKFDACLDTGRHTEQVQDDLAAGGRAGVTGTPALFLNGMPIDGGAVPYEVVAKAIDAALVGKTQ